MTRRAALFDMDRTLVSRQTASLYVGYQRELGRATWLDSLRVGGWLLKYALGRLDAPGVAEKVLARFSGTEESAFALACEDWFGRYVLEHVSPVGRAAVERHREAGDILVIVTAAVVYAARPLGKELDIEHVVASEIVVERGKLTARPRHPLCYGEGKVSRTLELADKLEFSLSESTFYTDSATDLPLLERVGSPVAVNPDVRLRWIAARRGWPIVRW